MDAVKLKNKPLLDRLIYEKVKGKPIYYKNYEKALKGEIPPEAIMGSADLQAYLISLLIGHIFPNLDRSRYLLMSNEPGFYTSEDSFRLLDLAIFEKDKFQFTGGYTKIPPRVVIEVDTKADLSGYTSVEEYAYEKTQELLNAGVERVIWIFTKTRKVMIADRGNSKWIVQNWDEDFEVMKGIRMNLNGLLE